MVPPFERHYYFTQNTQIIFSHLTHFIMNVCKFPLRLCRYQRSAPRTRYVDSACRITADTPRPSERGIFIFSFWLPMYSEHKLTSVRRLNGIGLSVFDPFEGSECLCWRAWDLWASDPLFPELLNPSDQVGAGEGRNGEYSSAKRAGGRSFALLGRGES